MKTRKCNHCGKRKELDQMIYKGIKSFCDTKCLTIYAKALNSPKIKVRFENKDGRSKRLKTTRELLKEAQAVFNRYVRFRDIYKRLGCISCNKPYDGGKWDAGHYISRRHNKTRFHLDNVHLQCVKCNRYGYGEAVAYRLNLQKRIGQDKVKWLEDHYLKQHKFTSDYLQRFKKVFSKKARRMENKINDK
jgi:hypothetical protein